MPSEKDIIYLLDGTSYLHRAFHAIRDLSNSKGFPTNAVFGFTKMVLKLLAEKQPKYFAVVFDAKGPTFRHEIYGHYKANRPPMAEDLTVQIPVVKEVLQNLNIMVLEEEGYEADDIIGTLAKSGEEKGFSVVMVTGDKDFRQLISPSTSMWDPMKDKLSDYEALKREYGVEPAQFVDVMGLSGDRVDNIPGVRGFGEKTALQLIREYGTLENVLEHATQINKKRLRENLLKFHREALLSRDLVRINRSVPIEEDVERLRLGNPNNEGLSELFRRLEFRELFDQFASRHQEPRHYGMCLSQEALQQLVKDIRKRGVVSIVLQTTCEDPLKAKITGLAFCSEKGTADYVSLHGQEPLEQAGLTPNGALGVLKDVIEDEKVLKVSHNIKYCAEVFRLHGIELKPIHFDPMIASYVINPGLKKHDIAYLAQYYLNLRIKGRDKMPSRSQETGKTLETGMENANVYCSEEADISLRLMNELAQRLKLDENEELFHQLEMQLVPVLADMELTGVKLDTQFLVKLSHLFARKMEVMEKAIYEEAGMEFNINSSQQLGYVLFEKLRLPVQKRTFRTKKYSTDVNVLNKLSVYPNEIPRLVLQYRSLAKLKSTYLDSLVDLVDSSTGRIHTCYNQTVTATGRLSSSNPNLQNIPVRGEGREIRKAFIAEEGHYLLSADYSQIELRVFAHFSEDTAFIEAFQRNEDIHARTASEVFGLPMTSVTPDMRRIAKAINFGIIYGMGPQRLSQELGTDQGTAKHYIASFYNKHPGVVRFREDMIEIARKNGYVTTLFNRRRYLPEIQHEKGMVRAEAERMAINTPIQGTAADLIKKAMINIHRRLKGEGFTSKMLLQVHDELVFEVPEEELRSVVVLVCEEMEGVHSLNVPLKVDTHTGKNWEEAH